MHAFGRRLDPLYTSSTSDRIQHVYHGGIRVCIFSAYLGYSHTSLISMELRQSACSTIGLIEKWNLFIFAVFRSNIRGIAGTGKTGENWLCLPIEDARQKNVQIEDHVGDIWASEGNYRVSRRLLLLRGGNCWVVQVLWAVFGFQWDLQNKYALKTRWRSEVEPSLLIFPLTVAHFVKNAQNIRKIWNWNIVWHRKSQANPLLWHAMWRSW